MSDRDFDYPRVLVICAIQRSLDWRTGRLVESDRPSSFALGRSFDIVGSSCGLLIGKLLKDELVVCFHGISCDKEHQ